jgi:hypothetical protein
VETKRMIWREFSCGHCFGAKVDMCKTKV